MSVPGFQKFLMPLLQLTNDGQEHRLSDAVDRLADDLTMTAEDRRETVPSGRQTKLHNRISWASTYLKKAGLLESTGRGRFRITDAGRAVIREGRQDIDMAFLDRFPGFKEFKTASSNRPNSIPFVAEPSADETPEERLDAAYVNLRQALAQDLLERVKSCSPQFFEKLVVDLLVAMGYGGSRKDAAEAVGRAGDTGIDGIIKEDRLGLSRTAK